MAKASYHRDDKGKSKGKGTHNTPFRTGDDMRRYVLARAQTTVGQKALDRSAIASALVQAVQ